MKRRLLKDMILEKWELMDPEHAIWYCTFLMVGSWVVFWAGVSQYQIDFRLRVLLFVSGGFLLTMSEVLYRKYRAGMRKRRIMG